MSTRPPRSLNFDKAPITSHGKDFTVIQVTEVDRLLDFKMCHADWFYRTANLKILSTRAQEFILKHLLPSGKDSVKLVLISI